MTKTNSYSVKKLKRTISTIVKDCLRLQQRESVLIVTDEKNAGLANQFWQHTQQITPFSYLLQLPRLSKKKRSILLPLEASGKYNLILLIYKHCLQDANYLQNSINKGTCIACIPDVDPAFLIRSIPANYSKIKLLSQRLADIFTISRTLELRSETGTSLKISIQKEKGISDFGILDDDKCFTILPGGRAQIRPAVRSCHGILVADGSLDGVGLIKEPMKLYFKNGSLSRIYGGEEAQRFRTYLRKPLFAAKDLIRIGVGTNANAKLTGNLNSDACVYGVIHICIGSFEQSTSTILPPGYLGLTLRSNLLVDDKPVVHNGKFVAIMNC